MIKKYAYNARLFLPIPNTVASRKAPQKYNIATHFSFT